MEISSHLLFATNLRLFREGEGGIVCVCAKVSVLENKIYDIRIK